jgi:hypothetical protein
MVWKIQTQKFKKIQLIKYVGIWLSLKLSPNKKLEHNFGCHQKLTVPTK